MTVCVAAICDENAIVIASDRMLTVDDTTFETRQSKVSMVDRFAVLVAGDVALQTEIIQGMHSEVAAHGKTWRISDVADSYVTNYNRCHTKRATSSILAPLGLDHDSFIARQKDMAGSALEKQLTAALFNFQLPDVQIIIAGINTLGPPGPHIYAGPGRNVNCEDAVGFAAIGYGEQHARSHFMLSGHTRRNKFAETLWLVYSAKRRAEVAPFVGAQTDILIIGPQETYLLADDGLSRLAELYNETKAKNDKENRKAGAVVQEMMTALEGLQRKGPTDENG